MRSGRVFIELACVCRTPLLSFRPPSLSLTCTAGSFMASSNWAAMAGSAAMAFSSSGEGVARAETARRPASWRGGARAAAAAGVVRPASGRAGAVECKMACMSVWSGEKGGAVTFTRKNGCEKAQAPFFFSLSLCAAAGSKLPFRSQWAPPSAPTLPPPAACGKRWPPSGPMLPGADRARAPQQRPPQAAPL